MYNGADWAAKDASNIYIVAYTGYTNVPTNGGVIPNTPAADVRITEGGAGTNTLANAADDYQFAAYAERRHDGLDGVHVRRHAHGERRGGAPPDRAVRSVLRRSR